MLCITYIYIYIYIYIIYIYMYILLDVSLLLQGFDVA